MATLTERLRGLFRYRVGKYDSQSIESQVGIGAIMRSGVNINEQTALSISTVYACVYKIASTVASLGLKIYVKNGRNVDEANVHPAFALISEQPNDNQTAFEFWESIGWTYRQDIGVVSLII